MNLHSFYNNLEVDSINEQRKELLRSAAATIGEEYAKKGSYQLSFVCTHNSRRSMFGQVMAHLAFQEEGLEISCFSAGTEETAVHSNTIEAIRSIGIDLTVIQEGSNPVFQSLIGKENLVLFSKTLTHPTHPQKGFSAMMTCSDAGENCPFIPGADHRINLYYTDPKWSDNTDEEAQVYREKVKEIGTEMKFLAQCIREKLNIS